MVTTSLLKLNMDEILGKVERLTGVEFPRDVIEVSLEPELKVLCIRFRKPSQAEFGEPLRCGIHVYTDKDTKEIAAVEITDLDKLLNRCVVRDSKAILLGGLVSIIFGG